MKKGQIFFNRVLALLVVILVTVGHFDSYAFAQDVSRLTYEAHSQNIGWQSEVSEGTISGTTGRSLRLEALKIQLLDELQAKGDIEYRVHVKDKGWLPWVKNGAQAGTTGESRRAEAVEIRLTGELSTLFDIEYQVHVKDIGWLSWVKNGAQAGTTGESRRAEAVKIRLVDKFSPPSTDDKEDPSEPEEPVEPEEPSTPPVLPEVIKYTVTFRANAKGVESIPVTQQVKSGAKASEPVSPTLVGYDFKGWTKTRNGEDYWEFDKDTVTKETILYAKWGLTPLTVTDVEGFGGSAGVTDAGDEVTLAGVQWRILKVNDNKALVIKTQALTESEAIGTGATDSYYSARFRDGNYYFTESGGANGYEAGAADNPSQASTNNGTTYLKGAIDYYYLHSIAPDYSDYVLSVNLNNPSYGTYVGDGFTGTANSITSWSWNNFYQDTRFATIFDDGSKQAFALSYGDIHTIDSVESTDYYDDLLNFSSNSPNYFWLRSAGYHYNIAGNVNGGNFNNLTGVNNSLPVRPALWISLD